MQLKPGQTAAALIKAGYKVGKATLKWKPAHPGGHGSRQQGASLGGVVVVIF